MNNRFCEHDVRKWLRCLCAVSVCSCLMSCSDDYKWDDKDPDFLNSSIYETLKSDGNYRNFVKLIDDLDYAEVLNKTGSKTLFVTGDDAFNKFFESNDWGVKSYSELSTAQKRLLLYSAMIDNAYLVEMMSNREGPVEGACLRRVTSVSATDSIPHFEASDLPVSYNDEDKDYWARFREPGKGGIRLALDQTAPMMTHFLAAQMSMNNITDEDFEIIVGVSREKNDAYIYDSKIIQQDITCTNGYINKLDNVLFPRQNMAEMLRTNGSTNIFSHMIERFSAPYYVDDLTKAFNLIPGNSVDSVFEKSYLNTSSLSKHKVTSGTTVYAVDPQGNQVDYGLNFDPGWNEYRTDEKTEKEEDMGVIFAPSDEKLYNYFFAADGGGRFLLEAYAPVLMTAVTGPDDYEHIYQSIDQIPLKVIQALLNNLMKISFINSVPSKFETVKDDAQDPLLTEEDKQHIDRVLLANNGIIYVMDEVLTPAKYASVSAPALVAKDMQIFNWAINQTTLDVRTDFYAYLLAMSSRFSFFVPCDADFWYIDPASFAAGSGQQRAYHYEWNEKTSKPTVTAHEYTYDYATKKGSIGAALSTTAISQNVWANRLRDMLDTHTIVHEDKSEISGIDETSTGMECQQQFFLAKNGAPIYVQNATQRDKGCVVQGGFQYGTSEACKVIRFDDKSRETNGNGNGYAYETDRPIQPTIESVYSIMMDNPDKFGRFMELCETDVEVLQELGLKNNSDQRRYQIFVNNKGIPYYDSTGKNLSSATNVRFFNNFNYTVYIPTNAAVEKAIANGLPTWRQIRDILEIDLDQSLKTVLSEKEEEERRLKCLAMVTSLVNFVRYHFQDNSVFADIPALKLTQYETATLSTSGVYSKVGVSSEGHGTLNITDATGKQVHATADKNLLARDYVLSGTAPNYLINASSFAVIHGIDGVLDYKTYTDGKYSSDWISAGAARRYLDVFNITE